MGLLEKFSPIGFGGASISGDGGGYGFGNISDNDSSSLLIAAFERGVRLYDTAPIYGFGSSEYKIGKTFKSKRDEIFIVSKCGVTWDQNKRIDMSNDPKVTRKMLESSLRNLNSDYIDLYMIHWPDENIDIRKPLEILEKARENGKVLNIGLCNTFVEDLEKAKEITKISAVQNQFNVFNCEIVDTLFPYLRDNNISFMSWGTLDKGILTGRVDKKREQAKDYDEYDCRRKAPWWKSSEVIKKLDKLDRVRPLLKEHNHSLMELALGFNLSYKDLTIALVGVKSINQLNSLYLALDNLPSNKLIRDILSIINED